MQRLQPLNDLWRYILKLVDQQMAERCQRIAGNLATAVQLLSEGLERTVERHQALGFQSALEMPPEQLQRFDEVTLGCLARQPC